MIILIKRKKIKKSGTMNIGRIILGMNNNWNNFSKRDEEINHGEVLKRTSKLEKTNTWLPFDDGDCWAYDSRYRW